MPTPGRAADEQRVVGLGGHLGDGQRGGVGEAVAVADHELVEGELGVAERRSVERVGASRGGVRWAARSRAAARRARRRVASGRRRARRLATRARRWRPRRARARRWPGAACRSARGSSAQRVRRRLERAGARRRARRPQRRRARCGRWARRRRGRAAACTRVQMCSSSALTAASVRSSPGGRCWELFERGPRGPGRATIANGPPDAAWRACPQLAGN